MKKILSLFAAIFMAVSMWGTNLISYSRPASQHVISTGFSYDGNLSAKTGYMQDNSSAGTTYWMSLSRATALFSTAPTSVTLTANLGGGTANKDLDTPIYACFIDNEGNAINNTEVEVTSAIGAKEGTDYQVNLSTAAATSAYGIKIYHVKTASYNVRFYSISLDYVSAGGAVEPVEATWSIDPATVTVEVNADETVEITTNYDGTLEVSSDATGVATATIEGKTITVHGVASGNANITVTGAATSNYTAINKQFSVSVVAGERPYTNTIDLTDKFGCSYFGATPEGSNTYAQPDETNRVKTDDILTMTIARNGSSNTKPRYDAAYLRFYKGNTLTIAVPSNYNITSVTFVEPASGAEWSGNMSVPSGVYNNTTKKWTAASDINTITFTGTTGTSRIGGIIVRVNGPEYKSVTINATAGYATYACAHNFTISGAEAYKGALDGNTLTLTQLTGIIPAEEGVILKKIGGGDAIVTFTEDAATATVTDNDLVGTLVALDAAAITEIETAESKVVTTLGLDNEGNVGFRKPAGGVIAANKAYLLVEASASDAPIRIIEATDEVTAVENVEATETVKFMENGQLFIKKNGVIYNAMGQVVK